MTLDASGTGVLSFVNTTEYYCIVPSYVPKLKIYTTNDQGLHLPQEGEHVLRVRQRDAFGRKHAPPVQRRYHGGNAVCA
jgi:hypothetical protein